MIIMGEFFLLHGIGHLINVTGTTDTRWILVQLILILKQKYPMDTMMVIVYATYSSDMFIEEGRVYVQTFKMWDFEIEKILDIYKYYE